MQIYKIDCYLSWMEEAKKRFQERKWKIWPITSREMKALEKIDKALNKQL